MMDQVLADTLTANLKAARTPESKMDAVILALIALVDCQLKTAQRVKTMWDDRGKVAWGIKIFNVVATSGGFAAIVKIMKVMGVL